MTDIQPNNDLEKIVDNSIYRILDAAINRAGEGLRVAEDYLRMVVADAHLARQLKQLRHDLTQSVAVIDLQTRIAARDSEGDVGRQIQTESEYDRKPLAARGARANGQADTAEPLVQANLARTQQALRSIEEFSKTINVEMAKQVEQLRYRTYTLEKAILTTMLSLRNFGDAKLYVLVRGVGVKETGDYQQLIKLVQSLVEAGVGLIQLRDKDLSDREMVSAGRVISKITNDTSTRFVMNDRADLALASRADGVHLGQEDLLVSDARRMLGAAKLIGVSTHSIEQARAAVLDGANYIGVGPVFESKTKFFKAQVGLELVEQVAAEIKLPAFAIGGINDRNIGEVVSAGMNRVAVGAAVVEASDPATAAKELLRSLSS